MAQKTDTMVGIKGLYRDGNLWIPIGVSATGQLSVASTPSSQPESATHTHSPAANTAAVVTLAAAGAGVSNVMGGIYWSYDDDPTGGNILVQDGATTVLSVDVTAGGTGFLPFDTPIRGSANTQLVVTLAAGGAGISGKINVHAWTE